MTKKTKCFAVHIERLGTKSRRIRCTLPVAHAGRHGWELDKDDAAPTKPSLAVTGFWMRNDVKGRIEVLVEHKGKWLVVFGKTGPGPVACDDDQMIDHMIHAGGVQNLIDSGHVHGRGVLDYARPKAKRAAKRKR